MSSPDASPLFAQVPHPLRYAEALLERYAGLARATDADTLLGDLAQAAAQLSDCELSQLYLLDDTHTRLCLAAEWLDGLLQPREAASLPSALDCPGADLRSVGPGKASTFLGVVHVLGPGIAVSLAPA